MGLDQSAFTTDARGYLSDDDAVSRCSNIASWRKHPNLHGWIHKLHVVKGGNPDPDKFNRVAVEVDAGALDALESSVLGDKLPATQGFFFGSSRPEDKKLDIAFIAAARAAIARGERVYYSSCW